MKEASKSFKKYIDLNVCIERNPIERIWKQISSMGFKNEFFNSLSDVVERDVELLTN